MKAAKGIVFKYGDNVDTDVIIPARYLNSSDPAELAAHCMEDIDKVFIKNVKVGDLIVADKNFGCGSSREHAPIAIKAAGVSCVIAETFARIFYRNAINIGLPIIECPEASRGIEAGDEVEVDFDSGRIRNLTKGTEFKGQAFPEFMQKIIGMDTSQQFVKCFFMRRLVVLIPVDIGKAPEEGVISHVFGHLEVFGAVFTLRRPVISGHGLSGDILVELFYVSQLLFKCFFCRDR